MTMGQSPASPLVEAYWADAPPPRRIVLMIVARSSAVVLAALLVYSRVPVREETSTAVALLAIVGLAIVAMVFGRQLARIQRSARPVLAAIEALTLVVTLFVVLFAFIYVSLSAANPQAFTQPVTKVSGVYFTVTVLATVGFGDISAVTDSARIVVTVQMVLDLIIIGVAVKVLGTSARRAVEARVAERMGQAGQATPVPGPGVEAIVDDVVEGAVEAVDRSPAPQQEGASGRRADEEG